MTTQQFDSLCWRKLGFKLENGHEPKVPRRFKDKLTGVTCEIDRASEPWTGRTIDGKDIWLVAVTCIFADDLHRCLRAPRTLDQLEEVEL